ncbi:uncharacterized protein LOC110885047 [Helianthus annuus]|uniref:uncharacterized protein LOC110885047 n=1 Tax=Helianthus annuus TaxID=4232 RepID=UPI000B8F3D3C|nr:uncharacterized protein LOC110885047 [Helianthus annuus]
MDWCGVSLIGLILPPRVDWFLVRFMDETETSCVFRDSPAVLESESSDLQQQLADKEAVIGDLYTLGCYYIPQLISGHKRHNVKAIVVTGAKGKFSGGFDISAFGALHCRKGNV